MRNPIILIMTIYFLSGCASTGYIPPFEFFEGEIDKVGLITELSDAKTHRHLGATVFENFEKDLDFNWELEELIFESLDRCFSEKNIEVIKLEPLDGIESYFDYFSIIEGEQWAFSSNGERERLRLQTQYDIDALIHIQTVELCVDTPCELTQVEGFGLYSRRMLGENKFIAVHHVIPIIYALIKPGRIGGLKDTDITITTELEEFPNPESFENLNVSDYEIVENSIKEYILAMTSATCQKIP